MSKIILVILLFFLSVQHLEASTTENWMCSFDINGDGYVDSEGELAQCRKTTNIVCPSGYTFNFTLSQCAKPPSCPSGYQFNTSTGQCVSQVTTSPTLVSCPVGYSYDSNKQLCILQNINYRLHDSQHNQHECPFGLNCIFRYCFACLGPAAYSSASSSCAAGYLHDSNIGMCILQNRHYTTPDDQCPFGRDCGEEGCYGCLGPTIYNPSSASCPSGYLYDSIARICILQDIFYRTVQGCYFKRYCDAEGYCSGCLGPAAFSAVSCPTGYTYNSSTQMCTGTLTASPCSTGDSYSSQHNVCIAACSLSNTCNVATNWLCPIGAANCNPDGTCPLGSQYQCLNNNGVYQCSANSCVNMNTAEQEVAEVNNTMFQDDGQVDEHGNCLGQIYLFTGKASRCRPKGLTVGLLNNCCKSNSDMLKDSTGSANTLYTTLNTVRTVYDVARVVYYSEKVAAGAAMIRTGSTTIISYGGKVTTLTGNVGQAVAAGAGNTTVAMQNYMGSLFNPTTIAVAAVAQVAMMVLMGSGCDQNDMETSLLNKSGYCHHVGDYCERRIRFLGCVQRARGYCCFNSKLARIIHQQGRPQLAAFSGGWGEARNPNCRGFTPEEFQMLDFSKMDLGEYFGEIQANIAGQAQIQQKATEKMQQFHQQIRN